MDGYTSISVPSDSIKRIVGVSGVTKKSIEADFGVRIELPEKSTSISTINSNIGIRAMGLSADIQGAIAKIEEVCGLGSPSKSVQVFLFKQNLATNSIQLLLQFRHGSWTIPNERVPEELADVQQVVLTTLQRQCGSEPPYEELVPLDPLDIKRKKIVFHLCAPPTKAWNDWNPAPLDASGFRHEGVLELGSTKLTSRNFYAWADIDQLHLRCSAADSSPVIFKYVSDWFKYNSDTVLPQVYSTYGTTQPPVKTPSTSSSAYPPNWGESEDGQIVMRNFRHISQLLLTLEEPQFTQYVQQLCNPNHLLEIFAKWRENGQELPN